MRRTTIAQQIADMTAALSRPRYIRVTAEFLVHESQKGPACPCCGSRNAAIVDDTRDRIPAADIVLDLEVGDRFTADDVDAPAWAELCALAEPVDMPIRCSRNQLPLLQDDTGRHLFASGSQRSGKTTAALYWLALQWLRRGGFQRRFWLVASTLPKAFRLLQKLCVGDADSPAIMPRALIDSMPATHRASDLTSRLVDGSAIDLRYFDGDPSAERLKSDPIIGAVVDEASHLPGEDSITALRGRCQDHAGRLFFASTPRPETFIKTSIVDPAQDFERLGPDDPRRLSGQHEGARYRYAELPITENPWLDQDAVAAELATLDLSRPAVQRDYFGKWVGSTGPFWLDWVTENPEHPEKQHTYVHDSRDVSDFGAAFLARLGLSNQVDITGRLVSRIFFGRNPHYRTVQATNKRYLLGTDVNCHPMSTCILQVTGDRDNPDDKDRWHYWIHDVVRTPHGNSHAHVQQLQSTFYGKNLEPGKVKPFDGCGVVIDARALGRDPTVHKFGGDPRGIAELFGRANMDVRAPEYKPSDKGPVPVPPGRWDSFASVARLLIENRLHVSSRAEPVQKAFVAQQDSGNGHEPTKNDPLDSAMDGMRYAIWACLHAPVRESFERLR